MIFVKLQIESEEVPDVSNHMSNIQKIMESPSHQSFAGLPIMNAELIPTYDEDTHDYALLDESPEVYLTEYIGADCCAVITKYRCHPEPIVEFNTYAVEEGDPTPQIFNTSHPEYHETLRKILGRQRRTFILEFPGRYLPLIDYCCIYMGTEVMVRLERNHEFNTWFRRLYNKVITLPDPTNVSD